MVASTRFLSAVAFAFVAGVASTSAYMSGNDGHRDAPKAPHVAAPSLSERLHAEAHGQSLPWSEPVKAKPAPSKLTFTLDPGNAPTKEGGAVADKGRAPIPQATPAPASIRPPDDGGRSRVWLAQSDGQTPPPEEDQADLAPAIKRARPSEKDIGPSRARMVEAPIKRAQSSGPASQPDEGARHPRAISAGTPRHALPPAQSDAHPRVKAADVPRRIRPSAEEDRPRTRTAEARRERVRVRQSVAATDGLMRWLSGPDGRF